MRKGDREGAREGEKELKRVTEAEQERQIMRERGCER